jgi:MFS transporter, DHA1 family, tetracycline resistance protein
LLLRLLVAASFFVYMATFDLLMRERFDLAPREIGLVLSMAGWLFAIGSLIVVPRLVRTTTEPRMLRLAFGFVALGRLGTALCHSIYPFLGCYVLITFGMGTAITTIASLTNASCSPERRAYMQGLSDSAWTFAAVLAPMLSGMLYQAVGPAAPALASSGVAAIGCALACVCVADVPADEMAPGSKKVN